LIEDLTSPVSSCGQALCNNIPFMTGFTRQFFKNVHKKHELGVIPHKKKQYFVAFT
jgi:hypothetical protein